MERVAFLLEDTGERISCMLNPESLLVQRRSGLRSRRYPSGYASDGTAGDDSLVYTGGGITAIEMQLLFDVSLDHTVPVSDVRLLTGPVWQLAENSPVTRGAPGVRYCRFIWGKSWNIPVVVSSVAERFDFFNAAGVPGRSWMSIRLLKAELPRPPVPAGTDDLLFDYADVPPQEMLA